MTSFAQKLQDCRFYEWLLSTTSTSEAATHDYQSWLVDDVDTSTYVSDLESYRNIVKHVSLRPALSRRFQQFVNARCRRHGIDDHSHPRDLLLAVLSCIEYYFVQ